MSAGLVSLREEVSHLVSQDNTRIWPLPDRHIYGSSDDFKCRTLRFKSSDLLVHSGKKSSRKVAAEMR